MPDSLMACVRLLDRRDVMTMIEQSLRRDELCGQDDGDCFLNALRRHLAKRLPTAIGTRFFPFSWLFTQYQPPTRDAVLSSHGK